MNRRAPTILAALALAAPLAAAQVEFELDPNGEFVQVSEPEPGSAEAVLAEARRELADERPGAARKILRRWIDRNRLTGSPWLPQAYLLLADAKVMAGDEYAALYDYEAIIRQFPDAPEFPIAVEREIEIATDYLNGKKRKFLGLRLQAAEGVGEELMIRAQERMPGSDLGELAGIRLADYYYSERQLRLASDMYEIFTVNYPRSEENRRAQLNQIFANVARFKGPEYDASGLIEARVLIERYINRYPAEAYRDGIGEGLTARIDESQAAQMLATARWYITQNDVTSARFVMRRLLRKHPRTSAARAALDLMLENDWIEDAQIPDAFREAEPAQPVQPADTTEDGTP
ncbi:MAG: outer membrane protein assembly factor BamD [Planctomycetota bacterium]